MDLDALDEALTGNEVTGEDLVVSIVLLAVGFALSYVIGRWRRRRLGRPDGQSQQVVGLVARVGQVLVIAVFAGWALTRLGSDIGLLTVMVLVAALIAVLAARPILEGMAASAALTTRPAFGIADEITVDDHSGEVLEITNRSTVIRLRDGTKLHIPNVEMLSKTIIVYTSDAERRSEVYMTIGFESDIDHAERVIRRGLTDVDAINRVGSIRARALTNGVELSIRFWHPSGSRPATTPSTPPSARSRPPSRRRRSVSLRRPSSRSWTQLPARQTPRRADPRRRGIETPLAPKSGSARWLPLRSFGYCHTSQSQGERHGKRRLVPRSVGPG